MIRLKQVTIGAVNGIARGGGNVFLVSLDMRFAFKSRAQSRQLDIGLDLVSDGGGSQYLPRLIGRGRAMEHILTGKDILAEEAERYGWVNNAFDNSDTTDAYIDETLSLLVLCPTSALVLIRQSVNVAWGCGGVPGREYLFCSTSSSLVSSWLGSSAGMVSSSGL